MIGENLTKEDWERILVALSHFEHNSAFRETLERVRRALGE